ncbi:MAG: Pdz/Dhr/GlgF [Candidatus Angelobacter sp.]|jgi:serine protease Do|nr:Pdz/Dhr/GlgF [Candidatus Angelobacter sp.]
MNWKKLMVPTSVLTVMAGMSMAASSAAAQTPKAPPAPPAAQTPRPAPAPKAYAYSLGTSGTGSYLGVDIADISSDRVAPLKLKDEHGVEITMVDRDGPAGKAGLKDHDVILDFNGTRVEGEEQLRRMIRETPPGRTITLGISRDGQPTQIKATLGDRRKAVALWRDHIPPNFPVMTMPEPPEMPEMPEMPGMQSYTVVRAYSAVAGMMVDNLTPQLGEYFGVKSGNGVLVRSVEKGSPAEAAGLKAGDVIVKVDNEEIKDRGDWREAMRKSGKVSLGIVRNKREQMLQLTLPERKRKDNSRLRLQMGDDDFDIDSDIDLSALENLHNLAPMIHEQIRMALPQAQREIELAQVEAAKSLREIQPKLKIELKNTQKQIDREMKNLEKQLKEFNNEE